METLLLLILALLPGIILLYIILFMDRSEKEPLGLVLKVIMFGAISVAPAALIEVWLGSLPIRFDGKVINAIYIAFFHVAWVEELCKLGVVLIFAWRNKNFNEENDGIVYVGASALGFAMLENVFYVLSSGLSTGILRAMTAMPLHCFSGVLMGYYVGIAKVSVETKTRRWNIIKGFLLAYILHGLYDALLLSNTPAAILIIPMVVGLFIFGFKTLKKGRALSLARLSEVPVTVDSTSQQNLILAVHPRSQLWKIIISRTLLTLSVLFWIALGLSILLEEYRSQTPEILLGGVIFSFLPILVGVMLEISYHRKSNVFKSIKAPVPSYPSFPASISAETELSPQGNLWRIIISRALLTICGLFWAVLVLVYISQTPEKEIQLRHMLVTGLFITFFPIYISLFLEDSYRKRKKIFNDLRKTVPLEKISSKELVLTAPKQVWKIILSRSFFGICGLVWLLLLLGSDLGKAESESAELLPILLGGVFLTALPVAIGIKLENSYRRKREEFNTVRQDKLPGIDPADPGLKEGAAVNPLGPWG